MVTHFLREVERTDRAMEPIEQILNRSIGQFVLTYLAEKSVGPGDGRTATPRAGRPCSSALALQQALFSSARRKKKESLEIETAELQEAVEFAGTPHVALATHLDRLLQ